MTNDALIELGARLKRQREARQLTIPDVSKVTKIPDRSILLLEAGSFDELPGDVFVRGFLKSYSRCVGLETEEVLKEYAELRGQAVRPRREPSLVKPKSIETPAVPAAPAGEAPSPRSAEEEARRLAEEAAREQEQKELSIFASLAGAGRGTSRVSLTLAVIILVIVATLTLSLLLRRPGPVGDGVSSTGSDVGVRS